MTEFAGHVVKWGLDLDTFTEQDVKGRFRDVCTRKRRATLVGLVVNGCLNRSTQQDGSHTYWFNKAAVGLLNLG